MEHEGKQSAYESTKYNSRTRWMNFWHQIDEVAVLQPQSVLEVGGGSGLVTERLRALGYRVTTMDVDARLHPDLVASVELIPVSDASYDVVLAAEVLEHLPFERVPTALHELRRVARQAVITLPHAGSAFILRVKIPWIVDHTFFLKIPFFWKSHYNKYGDVRGHYWEPGKRGYPRSRVRALLHAAGFQIVKERIFSDDIVRILFVLR